MTRVRGWETATSLFIAYESLAAAHLRSVRRAPVDEGKTEPHPYHIYKHAFALLILNASIIEGTVRTILTTRVSADLDAAVERGSAEHRTEHDAPTRLLEKFMVDLETSGGWENLKTAGTSYYGQELDSHIDKEVKEALHYLFVLRNVLAHGTALIQPAVKMTDDMKAIYPFKWQSRLQGVSVYLEKHFKRGGMFENLAHPDVPEHFMDVTKVYFGQLSSKLAPLPERAQNTVDRVLGFRFGIIQSD